MTVLAQNLTPCFAKADLLFRQNDVPRWRKSVDSGHKSSSPESSALVKYLFNSVTSPTLKYNLPTLRDDTEALRKVVELLLDATEDGTLTENETDTMLRLLAEGFIARRFNQIFERISKIDETNWFLAASRLSKHE